MAENSTIEWTDATWNPVTGCSVVSPGCTNCYAMGLAGTRLKHHPSRAGLTVDTKAGPVWNGKLRLNEEWLTQPLRWQRPRMIFVCAHGDLFHESVPDAWIDRVFAVMALCPQHTFQVLTKRSARMRAYLTADRRHAVSAQAEAIADGAPDIFRARAAVRASGVAVGKVADPLGQRWPLSNVWLGVSTEDQRRADERVPDLLATPAAVRFVSAEPLLGAIDFRDIPYPSPPEDEGRRGSALDGHEVAGLVGNCIDYVPALDWIIVGGESGPGARPMHPAWARSIRDQCGRAGTAFFFKQWGSWSVAVDRDKDDPDCRQDYSHALNDRRPDIAWLNAEGGRGFHGAGFHVMRRTSKATAGRLLDGRTHDEMPEVLA